MTNPLLKNITKSMLLMALMIFTSESKAATTYYYTPQPVSGVTGRVFYDQLTPIDDMGFNFSGQSDNQVSQPISGWNLGVFTGNMVPEPLLSYQQGSNNYGSTSVSINSSAEQNNSPIFGVMLNSYDYPYNFNLPLAGIYLQYIFSETRGVRPFSYGISSKLYYSQMLQVPQAYIRSKGQAQIDQGLTFVDSVSNMYFWFHPTVFSTDAPVEKISLDVGTSAYMVQTFVGNNTSFITKSNGSYSTTRYPWSGWRWYGYSISYLQMKNVISQLNKKISEDCRTCKMFSVFPENYRIGMMYTGGEVTRPIANNLQRNANVGYSLYGQWLYVDY